MRALLTGAAGFIGTAVGRAFEAAGHEVVRIDAFIPQAHEAGARPADVERLDVRDAERWVDRLRGVDVVCHQAALVGAGIDIADLPEYASINDHGTAGLLAAMHSAGVHRLVLGSSMVVYGEGRYACPEHGEQHPGPRMRDALEHGHFDNPCPVCAEPLFWDLVDEDSPLEPRTAYAASKVAQEHYASVWARNGGGTALALRYHNVYGAGMPKDTPYSGVAAMFRSALERDEPPTVFEDGEQTRDFVHVDDVARANLLAAELALTLPPTRFAAYNVCSGSPVTIAGVAELIARGAAHRIAPVVTGQFRLGDVRHVVASPERAERELGFHAEVQPEKGLPAFAREPLRGG
jgi:dTDP-L-rhamnose 4-epimerase